MKEMYLKVEVEQNCGDWVDVFYREGRYFTCSKDDAELVEIKDAEKKGAERLYKAINDIRFGNSADVKDAFDGYCTVSNIIGNFSPKEIIERVNNMKHHVPTQGDVYRSKHTNNNVVVLSYNEKTRETRYIAHNYESREKEDYLNEHYYFTGENIDVSALVNKIG